MFILEKMINLLEYKNFTRNLKTDQQEETTVKKEIFKKVTDDLENIDRYFLSFTGLPYLQINFHNKYNTPTGIYNYPLQYYITREEIQKVTHKKDGTDKFYTQIKMSIEEFPYVDYMPNVILFKITNECAEHLWRRNTFTKEDYNTQKNKLIKLLLLDKETKKQVDELKNEYDQNKKEYDIIHPLCSSFIKFEIECRPKKHKFKDVAKKDELAKYVQIESVEDSLVTIKKYVLDNIDKIYSDKNERVIREIKVLEQRYEKMYKEKKFSHDWYEDETESKFYEDYLLIKKVREQLEAIDSDLFHQLNELKEKRSKIAKFHDKFMKNINNIKPKNKSPEDFINEIITKIEENMNLYMRKALVSGDLEENYLGKFWFLIYQLCYKSFHNVLGLNPAYKDEYDPNFDSTAEHTISLIFRELKCLGILDDGTGFIHPNERYQCVFFGSTKKLIEYQQSLFNDLNKASTHYKSPKTKKENKDKGQWYLTTSKLLSNLPNFEYTTDTEDIKLNLKGEIKDSKNKEYSHTLNNFIFSTINAKDKEFNNCEFKRKSIFNNCLINESILWKNIIAENTTFINTNNFPSSLKDYKDYKDFNFTNCTFDRFAQGKKLFINCDNYKSFNECTFKNLYLYISLNVDTTTFDTYKKSINKFYTLYNNNTFENFEIGYFITFIDVIKIFNWGKYLKSQNDVTTFFENILNENLYNEINNVLNSSDNKKRKGQNIVDLLTKYNINARLDDLMIK